MRVAASEAELSEALDLLVEGCRRMGLELDQEAAGRFGVYLREVVACPHNLTAIRRPRDIVVFHFLDSVSVLKVLDFDEAAEFCDLGTGAGFPLLPLKILRPAWRTLFVDSRRKSVEFVARTAHRMGLEVAILHGHSEDLRRRRLTPSCDVLLSRALGPVAKVLPQASAFVRPAGRLVLYKGPGHKEELEEAEGLLGREFVLEAASRVDVPFLDRERWILSFRRLDGPED